MSSSGPTSRLETARLGIARIRLEVSDDLARALGRAVAISAATLDVARVGVWALSEDRSALVRIGTSDGELRTEPAVLPLAKWPAYAAAIDERRVIAAADARTDPRTSELADGYLVPLGISSMLDAPIFLAGEVVAIAHLYGGAVSVSTELGVGSTFLVRLPLATR